MPKGYVVAPPGLGSRNDLRALASSPRLRGPAAYRACAGNASFWFTGPAGSLMGFSSGALVKSATVYSPAPTSALRYWVTVRRSG